MAREFQGKIELDVRDSEADWDAFLPSKAPADSPNVLVVLYDDTGCAAWSPYGGRINMPTLDKLAANGLTYSQWHTTALCSPTRSTFLTGRNHHQNGFASISESASGFPGYSSHIPKSNGTMASVLRDAGYSTYWVGKNHNIPIDAWTAGGSKKDWPLAQGYDRFYGFIGGETNQWYPSLAEDNHYIDQPYLPEEGYHAAKDLADKALEFIRDSKQTEPDKPWYLWFCPGANHAPHHAPQEYIDKYKGMFDDGYEAYREWVLPRMIERGILPEGTELTEINPMTPGTFNEGDTVRPWDSLSEEEKRLFSRMAEVYAGFSEYTDAQVGRIIDYLEESGQLENTLVIYAADNGASGEGSPNGSVNEGKYFSGYPDTIEENLKYLDVLGSPATYNHYPTGWAVAFSTPYRMFKRYVYQGGIADPLIVSWPKGIAARGEVRGQYHHSTDIVPTILEACGVTFPDEIDGVKQTPLSGVSMAYSFDEAEAPTAKQTQYYEMFGNRGIWHDGWKAVTEHGPISGLSNFDKDRWQLFHTDVDRAEAHDLADENPEKLEELKALWMEEAKANNVLPLNDLNVVGKDLDTFLKMEFSVGVPPSGQYVYYPGTSEVPERSAANTHSVSFRVLGQVVTTAATEGVIFAQGSRFGGHALFVKDGQLHYVHNFLGIGEPQKVSAAMPTAGEHVLGVNFDKERMGEHHEWYGTATLYVDDQPAASAEIRTMNGHYALCGEGLCIGYDSGDSVSATDYEGRFDYSGGEIKKVIFDVKDDAYVDLEAHLAAAYARLKEETMTDELQRGILPIPDLAYTGTVTYDASSPDTHYPPITPVTPPDGAPNVLVILIDDVGFGASSAFGGPIATPNFERVAAAGLKYTRFHTTALCSPTRAALLSGRNHHTVGMGGITEIATSAPGYNSLRPNSCAPLAETLKLNGYATAQFGKCHEVPVWETSPMGPFDRWPSPGNGFEYFYGFIGGETNQWYPAIYEGTIPVEPWGTPEEGYHFMGDMTDKAIAWFNQQHALTPDKPFFGYFAPGATHAPHHVPQEWADKYAGKFDEGWDVLREQTFARQKKLGVVPKDAVLTERSAGIPAWDEMDPKLLPTLRREMEVYAGFLEYTDHHVGRVLDALEELGELDDTLVYIIIGDNGASAEGNFNGSTNELFLMNQVLDVETPEYLLAHKDELGTPKSYNHYAIGWAHAMDTPYQWTKQVASHWGGTRNGTIVSWPNGIAARGEIRNQFAHVIDFAPTVLEAAGIPEPIQVNGVTQRPYEGTAMNYTFDDAKAEERHTTQYFEMFANRAIYHLGWTAVAKHRDPWAGTMKSADEDVWELYHVEEDWTQSKDLAAEQPGKLAELQRLFLIQAARFNVLPLDLRSFERFDSDLAGRPLLIRGNTQHFYPGMKRLSENSVINVKNKSFTVSAAFTVPDSGANGVIIAQGGAYAGWSLYLHEGALRFAYNLLGAQIFIIAAEEALGAGDHEVRAHFTYEGGGLGKGGTLALYDGTAKIGEGRVDRTVPVVFSGDETLDIGSDLGSPVSTDYGAAGNEFTGALRWVRIDLGDDDHTEQMDPQHRLNVAMARQ